MATSLKEKYGPYRSQVDLDSTLCWRCKTIWETPFTSLKPSDYRVLIDQNIALDEIVPIALSLLEENPLIEADLYRGDLLKSIFTIPKNFWLDRNDLFTRTVELKSEVEILRDTLEKEILPNATNFKF